MDAEARRVAIRWRRVLFAFHLFMLLIVRLAVGSISEMPPREIYEGFGLWGIVIAAHGLLLAILDGRDRAELPFPPLQAVIEPRERRWLLFFLDAALWVVFTMAIASRTIPNATIERFVLPLALLWLAHTGIGLAHIWLMVFAEVRDRAVRRKRKNDEKAKSALLSNEADGENIGDVLVGFPSTEDSAAVVKQAVRRD
jgi:hypothetical protein